MVTPQTGTDPGLPDRCRRSVVELCSGFPSRNARNPKVLAGARSYLQKRLQRAGVDVALHSYPTGEDEASNLVVCLTGTDWELDHLVIGAHYDTVMGTPGADDNASGVAALLELISLLRGVRLRRTIHLVFFVHEEPPYFGTRSMGSYRFAHHLKDQGTKVRLMMSLEMLGFGSNEIRQAYPFPLMRQIGGYPAAGNFLGVVGNVRTGRLTRFVRDSMRLEGGLPIHSVRAPGFLPPFFLSDHWSFWRAGYPAVMITDTAFMRNPHYHRSSDTPETLNYDFLARAVISLRAAVIALDKLPDSRKAG
jgi:Zn-dependent M28 family amino/carboxypeptidase